MPTRYSATDLPNLTNANLAGERPIHLACGMAVVAEFATVEGHISLLLTALAQGDPVPVAAIYSVLRQGLVQSKALTAVAEHVLDQADQALLKRLKNLIKSASDERDLIAHSIWFYDQNIPDAVVLASPALMWRSDHEVKIGGGTGPTTVEHVEKVQGVMRDACQIWRGEDFDAARIRGAHSAIGLQAFRLMLLATSPEERSLERQKVHDLLQMASY